jgi:hypothetical protein
VFWTAGTGIGLLLIFAVGQGAIVSLLSGISRSDPARIQANYGGFIQGMLGATALILLNCIALYMLVTRRLRGPAFTAIAGLILILDTWVPNSKFIKQSPPPARTFAPDEAVRLLQQDKDRFRVYPLHYYDPKSGLNKADMGFLQMHGIQSIGGQHPNPLQSYMDFVGIQNTVMFQFPPNLMQRKFLDILNARYIISMPLPTDLSRYSQRDQNTIRMLRQAVNLPGLVQVPSSPELALYRNDSALGRAWLVPDFELAKDKNALISRISAPDFDPRRTVLFESDPGAAHGSGDSVPGTVNITGYDSDRIQLDARLDRPGFLVLSEVWHPDWKAYDNGRPSPVLKAYHALRAVQLGPGEHKVEFRFESRWFRLGTLLTLAAALLLAAAGAFALLRRPRS